jgi:hypothetical protein
MLVSWGLNKCRAEGLVPTLFATPMGYSLYRKLGYEEIGRFRVCVPGEDEYLDIPAMVGTGVPPRVLHM